MKRLLVVLVAAIAVSTVFARIADQQDFEEGMAGFVADDGEEDSSTNVTYAAEGIPVPDSRLAPFPFNGQFGAKFLSVDTGEATLWRDINVASNVYFDMVVQFNPCADVPDIPQEAKIAVYLSTSSNIVVMCAGEYAMLTNCVTTRLLAPSEWARLTILSEWDSLDLRFKFKVFLDGEKLQTSVGQDTFPSLTIGTSVTKVGFKGVGAFDDFVVRTTNPFIESPAATIADGNEGYASLEDALAEADANTVVTLTAAHPGTIPLVRGQSYKINLNNQEFGGFTVDMDGAHDALKVTKEGSITTYEAVAGVAYINNRPGGFATYYASVSNAMEYCTRSNFVSIVSGTNCTERVYIPQGTTLYLYDQGMTGRFSGTFDGPGTVFMNVFPSKYEFGNGMNGGPANGPTLFEPTWTGTFQIGWEVFNHRFVFNDFGNANSTVEIACTSMGVPYPDSEYRDFTGFPSGAWSAETNGVPVEGDGAPVILPTIKLSAPWTIGAECGWAGSTTVIPKLTGTNDFTVSANSNRTYRIGSIEGYTGTLATHGYLLFPEGLAKPFIEIGNIVYDGTPGYDDCLVKVYKGFMESDSFWCTNLNNTTVNSSPAHLAVGTYNDVSGIYLARAAATVDGEATGYRTVEEAVVAATNTIDAATQPPTIAIYDGSPFSEAGWDSTETDGVYVFNYVKAKIGETSYFSLTEALADAAAQAPDPVTVNLVAKDSETVVIPANVTLAVGGADFCNCAFTGSGAIKYSAEPVVDYMGNNLYQQLQSEGWTGTFIADYDVGTLGLYSFNFNNFGNTGSTVEIPEGQTVSGFIANYNPGETVTVNPTVKVSGTLEIVNGNADRTNVFTRISGAGTVTFSKNQGNELGCYRVGSLEDWNGEFTVRYSSDQLFTIDNVVSGSGTMNFEYKPQHAPVFGVNWRGNVVVSDMSSPSTWNGVLPAALLGGANSTVTIAGGSGYLADWVGQGPGGAVASTLNIAGPGEVVVNNGWPIDVSVEGSELWSSNYVNRIAALSGSTNLALSVDGANWVGTTRAYWHVDVLDGAYDGLITVGYSFGLRVDVVNRISAIAADECVARIALAGGITSVLYGPDGNPLTATNPIPVAASETKLVYAVKSGVSGLYAAVASVGGGYYGTLAEAAAAADAASLSAFTKLADTAEAIPSGWKCENGEYVKDAPEVPTIQPGTDSITFPVTGETTPEAAAAVATNVVMAVTDDVAAALVRGNVTQAEYQGYFNKTATAADGMWTVKAEFTEKVKTDVATAAAGVIDGKSATITVPAGLYYMVMTMTQLGENENPEVVVPSTLSDGSSSQSISKPGTTQGFIKVMYSTAPIAAPAD